MNPDPPQMSTDHRLALSSNRQKSWYERSAERYASSLSTIPYVSCQTSSQVPPETPKGVDRGRSIAPLSKWLSAPWFAGEELLARL